MGNTRHCNTGLVADRISFIFVTMPLTAQRILIISPESWGKSMLSKHHYAVALANAGHDVWFLLPPWADRELALQYRHPRVHLLFDSYSLKGARFLPAILRKAWYKRIVRSMEKHCGGPFGVVWSFDNSRFFDLDSFVHAFRIHHMMDYHTDYQLAQACSTAHLCLGVTTGIVQKMQPFNRHSYFVQHGYAPVAEEAALLPDVPQVHRALYTGNLLMPYVQWSWLHALVKSNPDVHFFLAGSYSQSNLNEHSNPNALAEVEKIGRNANVTLLGECIPGQMQSYLRQADVLFFAYRSNEFPEILANSHKIMAYLASGKPIVSHIISEYVKHDNLLCMASNLDKYLHSFREVIEHPEIHRSAAAIERRTNWANSNTYEQQIRRIQNLIGQLGQDIQLIQDKEHHG